MLRRAKMGKVIVVVGGQYGDEGKGKIVDYLADKADVIARATGGNNAGHTVVVGREVFKFHILPSGLIHKGKLNICGNGMVIYPSQIVKEISDLEARGFKMTDKSLIISSAAHAITEEQIELDKKTGEKVGTTGRGIGPCYVAKIGRTGLRMSEFVKQGTPEAKFLKPLVKDTWSVINKAIDEGKNVLVEGAQGTMLDIDHGTYPYVTSSNPTAGGACTGLGIGPTKIDKVIGITKAYVTRVGRGPFTTELGTDEQAANEDKDSPLSADDIKKANTGEEYYIGKVLRKRGAEYGTTTGRARRTGWFDTVIARYAKAVNGLSSIVITKLDCFSDLKRIKICSAYDIDGKVVKDYPVDSEILQKAKPVYEEMNGWACDISNVREFKDLPEEAKAYVKRLEEVSQTPISILSVGPERGQTFVLRKGEIF